ncbi:conserved Plasmodium protein, unknown function [Plasmodium sp. gorilla clade G2]|uniref:conserved Plasmodium protein, unknown function n=1 Tax=Plasmodium sp. gorilla clade G2 TaxID=880535 RepID=UPI000D210002|nr:conserved Plasmodium protein, unknown function [Plasmodium sp. gorilla clade G2]SOV14997.1 conserved Plasmodium protein, unknown function [Plasmodium sp. gorilla clade G2]
MRKSIILVAYICFIYMRAKCEALKLNNILNKSYFAIISNYNNNNNNINNNINHINGQGKHINKSSHNKGGILNNEILIKKTGKENKKIKENVPKDIKEHVSEIAKENKFLHFENNKKISINPLFESLCKKVSVSETCLYNIQKFYSEVNYMNLKNKNPKDNKYFCGVLYGKYENDEFVKVEHVFFSMNRSEQAYDENYLLHSEDRKRADQLAKMLNLEVVGFLYAYPDIGVDLNMSNKKQNHFIKLNKKMKTLNDEENELFIPMGGKEVLLSIKLMWQIMRQSKIGEEKNSKVDTHMNKNKYNNNNNNDDNNNDHSHNRDDTNLVEEKGDEHNNDNIKKKKNEPSKFKNIKKKKKIKQGKKNMNIKPFITLSIGMNKNNESIIVEAYEMNYDLLKLIKHDMIKDMNKQNSILQFEKNDKDKEIKIKTFDSEIDIMNELYLKCKNNILIKKIEIKKIDILFCVNNIPIFSHKCNYNYFFPYPTNTNYYYILQTFNHMIKALHNKSDIVNIFRDFNFLFFLTNIFSIDHDIPYFCNAVNDVNNSVDIPDHYLHILQNLSNNANVFQ